MTSYCTEDAQLTNVGTFLAALCFLIAAPSILPNRTAGAAQVWSSDRSFSRSAP
jgi:hypothetical protein